MQASGCLHSTGAEDDLAGHAAAFEKRMRLGGAFQRDCGADDGSDPPALDHRPDARTQDFRDAPFLRHGAEAEVNAGEPDVAQGDVEQVEGQVAAAVGRNVAEPALGHEHLAVALLFAVAAA